MDKKRKSEERREKEDATKYGEFIPSAFGWDTLEGQKKEVEKLENITNKNKKNKKGIDFF